MTSHSDPQPQQQLTVWDDPALHAEGLRKRAEEKTRRALEQVDEHADPCWKDHALDAVRYLCLVRPDFISDDIWTITRLSGTRDDRALGPVFLRAKRLGWCEKTDRTRPSVRSNLSGKPVWRSRLWREP